MAISADTPYTLYYVPDFASLVIRLALHELDLPYRPILVDKSKNDLRAASFLALNPQGLLPVLLDPDQSAPLFETGAILLHLAQRHKGLWPAAQADQGEALKWLFYISNTLHADLRVMFYTQSYVPDASLIPALRQGMRQRLKGHFQLLNDQIAINKGTWLLGNTLTVCDIYLALCARWALLYPRGDAMEPQDLQIMPHLQALLMALEQRPKVQQALAKEGMSDTHSAAFSRPALIN